MGEAQSCGKLAPLITCLFLFIFFIFFLYERIFRCCGSDRPGKNGALGLWSGVDSFAFVALKTTTCFPTQQDHYSVILFVFKLTRNCILQNPGNLSVHKKSLQKSILSWYFTYIFKILLYSFDDSNQSEEHKAHCKLIVESLTFPNCW